MKAWKHVLIRVYHIEAGRPVYHHGHVHYGRHAFPQALTQGEILEYAANLKKTQKELTYLVLTTSGNELGQV